MPIAQVLALVRICCAVALRDEDLLRRELRSASVEVPLIREAVLQAYLFAGYAAAINAFHVVNEIFGEDAGVLREDHGSLDSWRTRGEALCRRIYGKQYDRLVENMRRLHPDLGDWMIWEGYGKVLSRPFLSPRVRELIIVGMTAVLAVERQFRSHVRGSLHVGATTREIRSVFEDVAPRMPPAAAPRFRLLLRDLRTSRRGGR
jgi:alkylhydroperoxidase/carboxymuconolactone decarboxylase family protein YurZ